MDAVTTIRSYREEHARIEAKARKLSRIAGTVVGAGTGGLFLIILGIAEGGHQHTAWGPHAAAAVMGTLFGALGYLLIKTTHRDGKHEQLKRQFQADTRADARGEHGLAVQHDTIHPDLEIRVGYALKDEKAVPVKVWFADEDSTLRVEELVPAQQ